MLTNNSFITNNVKEMQSSKKRLKLMQYFQFSHGKSNSCGSFTAYFGTGTFIIKKQQKDKEGRILILDVSINDSEYILINLYNAITEKEQDVLSNRNPTKQIVIAEDFNLFFDSKLEAQGVNPTLKRNL